jgi:beta-galactosidase/beta-glucuronidase
MQNTELHPRPQLTRPRWTDLGGQWQFAYDDNNRGIAEHWIDHPDKFDRTITVPFPPESQASGIGDTAFHPVVWYRRTFTVPAEDQQGRMLLHFGAVDYRAHVWVNGQLVAEHEGGHTPFTADISAALRTGVAEQVVVVRAEDQPQDLAQPRGKQYWHPEPGRIWYHRTTGIWQPVWLEPVGNTFITTLRWTPDLDRGLLGLHVRLNAAPQQPLQLRVRLSLRGTPLADDTYTMERQETRREIALESAGFATDRKQLLWSPRYPNLIDATITLLDNGEPLDEVQSYVGLRRVEARDGRFWLNGVPYYLRLVLAQNYWPESLLAAPSSAALRREVELVKALGFNGVRIHQKIEDPRFLYWCDKLGVLVWGEMANAYVYSAEAAERLTREWLEAVRRDYNHPSVVTWVPLNESWGVPNLDRDGAQRDFVRGLYYLTRALDPTRPVIGNDGWQHVAGDILGIHDYALEGNALRERYGTPDALNHTFEAVQPLHRTLLLDGRQRAGEPVMLTEFGGISYTPNTGEQWFGYGTVSSTEEFLAKYEELVTAVLDCPSLFGFCYTQLTDTEQETNGLLHADRTPKLDMAAVRAVNTRVSKAVPGDIILNIQVAAEVTTFEQGGS